jgi:hypothetical protein
MTVKDIKATIVKDILSNSDYEKLKSIPESLINKNIKDGKEKYDGFSLFQNGMYKLDLPELDVDRTIYNNLIEKLSKTFNFELTGAFGFFARYSGESPISPNLTPHFDTAGDGLPTLTISIQLSGNIEWPIYINDDGFILNNNDAIVFSGTNNIHWRPNYNFLESDYLDIFVCHLFFNPKHEDYLPDNHFEIMTKQQDLYNKKYEKLIDINSKNNEEKVHLAYERFSVKVIDNIFTQDQINRIYKDRFENALTKTMHNGNSFLFTDTSCGYITSTYPLPEDVQQTIIKAMQEHSFFLIENVESHFPRYTLDSGSKPQLKPHYDSGLQYASLTLSIQLKSSKPWQVCVEQECHTLKENQAIMFSGSHQLHWRPDIDFNENDYNDIIVCQVHDNSYKLKLNDSHRTKMIEKANNFQTKKYP